MGYCTVLSDHLKDILLLFIVNDVDIPVSQKMIVVQALNKDLRSLEMDIEMIDVMEIDFSRSGDKESEIQLDRAYRELEEWKFQKMI